MLHVEPADNHQDYSYVFEQKRSARLAAPINYAVKMLPVADSTVAQYAKGSGSVISGYKRRQADDDWLILTGEKRVYSHIPSAATCLT